MKVCQVINALDRADAVSLFLLETDRMLRALGHETEIYYEFAHRSLASRGRPVAQLPREGGDLVLFHYAGHSRILARVERFHGKRGVVFHNVTPAHFFAGMPETHEFCQRAIDQLPELPALFDFGVGVSAFNVEILKDLGFRQTRVQPIAWETSGLDAATADPSVAARWGDDVANVLVVARTAPHKGLHYAVRALREITDRVGREVRLLFVGKTGGYEPYLDRVREEIAATGLAEHIVLVGEVTNAELRGYYECADVLLQLSEHEGFCVPLVEAMAFDLPVVAAPAGAVAETLGGAGILLADRSPTAIAAGVAEALGTGRDAILVGQRQRRDAFSRSVLQDSLAGLLDWTAGVPRTQPPPRLPSVSVVVCTYNRARALERCLAEVRRLDYPEFEVVVVEGPSTDDTADVVDRNPDVKRVRNETRNLSISRNLGIAASTGEIVAFIDDDAVPRRDWLRALVEAYEQPTVGAAGGDVFGPGGDHLQFENGILSRYGRVIAHQREPDDRNDPDGPWYNTLMGTNSSFRRRALDAVGGFDENYEYYHDEADLCARLIQAGYRVEHVPRAVVWHGFEPGTARKSAHDFDFTVIVKNSIYYAFCVSGWRRRPWRLAGALAPILVHPARVLRWLARFKIGPGTAARGLAGWLRGVAQGIRKGFLVAPRRDLAYRHDPQGRSLRPYARRTPGHGRAPRHVALLSQQYPPDRCGGIGVYTEQLARGLVEEGHRVSVIASGPVASVDLRDGVEIYRVPLAMAPAQIPTRLRTTRKNVALGLGAQQLLRALVRGEGVQVVESPIWDAEGYAAMHAADVPLVLRLNTPMALAAEMQGWPWDEDLRLAAEMEWALLRGADSVIDPSGTIVDTIEERYGVAPGDVPVTTIPFGTPLPRAHPVREGPEVRFLFLGRLEPRKGIDVLLAAIPRVLETCPHARFEIAGGAPSPRTPESFAATLPPGLRARVRFHGQVDESHRAELYAQCDVFVAPSRYESFGIVYLEAMAQGRACVACDVGGPTRIVVPGQTGTLVPPADPDALAMALIDLARDPQTCRDMGRAARLRVEENYRLEEMVRRTIDVYEETIARSGHRRGMAAGSP